MRKPKSQRPNFKTMLSRYLSIKGLDIVVYLNDGETIELFKNRLLEDDEIVMFDHHNRETRIPLATIKSVDLFAA